MIDVTGSLQIKNKIYQAVLSYKQDNKWKTKWVSTKIPAVKGNKKQAQAKLEEIRPTEQEVDACIEYLKENGSLICDKTVRTTISQYKRGEIDITQRPKQAVEESTKTQLETLEDEQRGLQETLENVEQLENEVAQAEKKDKSIKIGD